MITEVLEQVIKKMLLIPGPLATDRARNGVTRAPVSRTR